jgi:hypothetical protein
LGAVKKERQSRVYQVARVPAVQIALVCWYSHPLELTDNCNPGIFDAGAQSLESDGKIQGGIEGVGQLMRGTLRREAGIGR